LRDIGTGAILDLLSGPAVDAAGALEGAVTNDRHYSLSRGSPGRRAVLDNYATHKHSRVRAWLQRHRRFTFRFTPTSCSWANAVEGLFAKLTRRRLKHGVFTSVVELQAAINRFIAETNDKPKPFVWTKSADAILAAVQRGRQALEAIH